MYLTGSSLAFSVIITANECQGYERMDNDLTLTYIRDERLDLVEELRERQNEMKETLRIITNAAVNLDLSRIIENYLSLEADIAKMLTMLDNLEEKLVVRC